ncbi:MAG: rhamnulokinase, partial [Verrucomicrobiia bacterium]
MPSHHAAIDLGAESGRVIVGNLSDGRITLHEVHRFPTGASTLGTTLRWNILRIFEEIKTGLKKAGREFPDLCSVSADSWGVDYIYWSDTDPILGFPFHYRDRRTDQALERAFARVPQSVIFAETGLQFMPFNTVYQWADDVARRPRLVAAAQ